MSGGLKVFLKRGALKISGNSKENTRADSIKIEFHYGCFPGNFTEFLKYLEHSLLKTLLDGRFCDLQVKFCETIALGMTNIPNLILRIIFI